MKPTSLLTIILSISTLYHCVGQGVDWVWAKSAGSSDIDYAQSIARDNMGNVYVSGVFLSESITFGSTTLINKLDGYADIFLVKYDPSGNVLWAKRAGGFSSDYGYKLAIDGSDNVYLAGYFKSSSITFGSYTLPNTASSYTDIFIAKYDPNGNVLWAINEGGASWDRAFGITTNDSGHVYVTGYFMSPSISFGTTVLNNSGEYDIFLAKYDSSGNSIWAKSFGGSTSEQGISIDLDGDGNIYVAGYFNSPSINFGATSLTTVGAYDIFLARFDPSGNAIWAKSGGGIGNDYWFELVSDNDGNVTVAGSFLSPSISVDTATFINASTTADILIASYDASGNLLWARSAGDVNPDGCYGISGDVAGNIYVTGYFYSPSINFGSGSITNASPGLADIFVVKYDALGNSLWATGAGDNDEDVGYAIVSDGNDNVHVAGYFKSSSITLGSSILNNGGDLDIFVGKLNFYSAVEDAIRIGGSDISLNLSGEIFTISLPEDFGDKVHLEMLDYLGRKVLQTTIIERSTRFDLDRMGIIPGCYFLRIISQGQHFSQQIIYGR